MISVMIVTRLAAIDAWRSRPVAVGFTITARRSPDAGA